ncbi:MAG: DUF2793 domain-containing protein [Sphingomonadales bacterium]|nr:MAG: DUF2793 domain-containing protein [Sphingomonadales bacterium]
MSDVATSRLMLPLLAAGQAQKEMYHNEALIRLDLVVQGAAVAITGTPPENPEPGQCWIISEAPEGEWTGHPLAVAGWSESGWRFLAPCDGMRMWLGQVAGFAVFSDGEWLIGQAHGRVFVAGQQLIGPRAEAIVEPDGGIVVDAEARAAILAVLNAMREHGLIETV